jgi:glycosyltransferase involved in cell wall biosynthesis
MPARAETRKAVRVCLIGPSMDILGGQAVQLARLRTRLETTPGISVGFIPVNPRLPGPFRVLQRIKYVRTAVTSLAYWFSLLRHTRQFDVIQAFSPSYWAFLLGPVPSLVAGRLVRRPVILNYHSGEAEDHLRRSPSAVALAKRFDAIVVPSAYLQRVFSAFGLPSTAIHNFVDADSIPFRERPDPRPRFLSNRNLEPMYNVACSVRAFAKVQARVPAAELVIAGSGSQRGELEALVAKLGLRAVTFAGKVNSQEMGVLLNEADILLNSPDIDNMPLSLIEAAAAGVGIVSTSTGGIPYMIEDGVSGLLVPPGDDDAMAAAALRLLNEPGLALRLTRQARTDCLTRYSWDAVCPQWVKLYEELARHAAVRT